MKKPVFKNLKKTVLSREGDDSIHISWQRAENGSLLPGTIFQERFRPFHSMKNPQREALRLEKSSEGCNFLIIIGGAALYHIPEYRERCLIFLLVPDYELFWAAQNRIRSKRLEGRDDIVCLVQKKDDGLGRFSERIVSEFGGIFQPLFHSKTFIYRHRSLEMYYKSCFDNISTRLQNAIDNALNDFLTQKCFGSLWLRHIIKNSSIEKEADHQLNTESSNRARWEKLKKEWRGKPAIIVGAGPGLEDAVDIIGERSRNSLIIASDTALPCLLDNDIRVDWVVSIDPQYYTLLHYLRMKVPKTVLFYDTGIHSTILRLFAPDRRIPLASLHPMSQWLHIHGADTIALAFHGTNAGSAALALALSVGPSKIDSYGIDFQNTAGKRYSRGSYQYDWAAMRSGRLNPHELYHYELASLDAELFHANGRIGYRSTGYAKYRAEFENNAKAWGKVSIRQGYTIVPEKQFFEKVAITRIIGQKVWKTFIQKLDEITQADIQNFLQYFFTLPKQNEQRMGQRYDVLRALMPFFANFCDHRKEISEVELFRAIAFARGEICHIMEL